MSDNKRPSLAKDIGSTVGMGLGAGVMGYLGAKHIKPKVISALSKQLKGMSGAPKKELLDSLKSLKAVTPIGVAKDFAIDGALGTGAAIAANRGVDYLHEEKNMSKGKLMVVGASLGAMSGGASDILAAFVKGKPAGPSMLGMGIGAGFAMMHAKNKNFYDGFDKQASLMGAIGKGVGKISRGISSAVSGAGKVSGKVKTAPSALGKFVNKQKSNFKHSYKMETNPVYSKAYNKKQVKVQKADAMKASKTEKMEAKKNQAIMNKQNPQPKAPKAEAPKPESSFKQKAQTAALAGTAGVAGGAMLAGGDDNNGYQ